MRTALLYTRVLGSADGRPNVSATAGYTTFPSTTLRPRNSAGSSLHARFQPFRARRLAYGDVAFVSPSVEVRGTPPGKLATPSSMNPSSLYTGFSCVTTVIVSM